MALPRFIVALAACAILGGTPVFANEIQEINQQFRKGDLSGALARAERYLATNPKDAQARFLKGLILADQGKTNEAIQIFTGLTEDYLAGQVRRRQKCPGNGHQDASQLRHGA